MCVSERGAYAPPLHSELGYRPERGGDEQRRGGLLLAVSACVVLALIGAIWSSYHQGVRVGGRDAPPRIAASLEPYKVAPQDPGGERTEHLGVRVFDVLEEDPPAAALEPTPPEEDIMALEERGAARAGPSTAAPEPASEHEPRIKPPLALADASALPSSGPLTLADAADPARRAAIGLPRSAPAEPDFTDDAALQDFDRAPAEEPAAPPGATAPHTYFVQVASYRTPDAASAGWLQFAGEFRDLVGGRAPDVARADLGDMGVRYRLRVGGFEGREAAVDFCNRLKARGGECLVVSS